MLRTRILARGLGALSLMLVLTACGGAASPSTSGSPAATAIGVTGAQTAAFAETGGCGKALGDDQSWGGSFTSPDSSWLLDLTIEGTFDAGTYTTADHTTGLATVFMTDGAGTTYDALVGDGTIAVDDGARSGSIDATLTAADGSTVVVAGPWQCESWD
jgi:hypothetical protein